MSDRDISKYTYPNGSVKTFDQLFKWKTHNEKKIYIKK